MVNWQDPQILESSRIFSEKIFVFSFGVYSWYFLVTLKYVEFPILTRKLRWHWTYAYYLGGRYFLILGQILFQCHPGASGTALALPSLFSGAAGICATGNLLVRSAIMWRRTKLGVIVVYIFALLEIGHWVVMITVLFIPNMCHSKACAWSGLPGTAHAVVPYYLYTFLFDLIILLVTVVGLVHPQVQGAACASPLWNRLSKHGILYFVLTMGVNMPFLALAWLDLNEYVAATCAPLSLTFSVIASSYMITSLLGLNTEGMSETARIPGLRC